MIPFRRGFRFPIKRQVFYPVLITKHILPKPAPLPIMRPTFALDSNWSERRRLLLIKRSKENDMFIGLISSIL